MSKKSLFKVVFFNHGKLYELYAKHVDQAAMYGFIEIEGMVFGKNSSVVVDPSEEKLKAEFDGVKRTYVPMHSVIRIDEVQKSGVAKIIDSEKGNVMPFPMPGYMPGDSPAGD